MSLREKLIKSFETNSWLVKKLAEGLSNDDSLALPNFKANNFNWVLGHILVSRNRVLDHLNRPKLLSPEKEALYDTGSELVTAQNAVPLEQLLKLINTTQNEISLGLQQAGDDLFEAPSGEEREQTRFDRIEGLHWHETYHLGQLEILRQVSSERESFP